MNFNQSALYEPKFINEWNEYKLYDLAIWKNGLAFKSKNFHEYGVPIIKIAELKNGVTMQTKYTKDIFDEIYYLKKNDMLFSWSGSPDTSIDIFKYKLENGWLNQHIFKVFANEMVENEYLFYLVKYLKPNFIAIAKNKQTTGLGHITITDLKKISVKIPYKKEQKAIAKILSDLDEKIEINNKINDNLEKIAQAIFKQWFVDFEFSNENGEPYKSSGGEMIESELGEIPKGWEIKELRELVRFIKGKKPKIIKDTIFENSKKYLTIDVLNRNSIQYAINDKVVLANKKDVLMVMDGASSGTLYYGIDGIVGSTLSKIFLCDEEINEDILFYFLKINESNIKSHLTGSAIPHTDKEFVNRLIISIPKDKILLSKATKIFTDIREKIIINNEEIDRLIKLRDTLLPKLMSGEIRVHLD